MGSTEDANSQNVKCFFLVCATFNLYFLINKSKYSTGLKREPKQNSSNAFLKSKNGRGGVSIGSQNHLGTKITDKGFMIEILPPNKGMKSISGHLECLSLEPERQSLAVE